MSDTPRTDAECGWYDPNGVRYPEPTGDHVDPDFARDLERELNAAKAHIERLEARCKRLEEAGDAMASRVPDDHWEARDQAKWRQAKEAKP